VKFNIGSNFFRKKIYVSVNIVHVVVVVVVVDDDVVVVVVHLDIVTYSC
jgi:hypothetical protein